jgi:hypothetical protein
MSGKNKGGREVRKPKSAAPKATAESTILADSSAKRPKGK